MSICQYCTLATIYPYNENPPGFAFDLGVSPRQPSDFYQVTVYAPIKWLVSDDPKDWPPSQQPPGCCTVPDLPPVGSVPVPDTVGLIGVALIAAAMILRMRRAV